MTKADILSGEKEVKVYSKGVYKSFPGWKTIYDGASKDKLVPELANYIKYIEDFVGVPVAAIGTGADRNELFWPHGPVDFWGL